MQESGKWNCHVSGPRHSAPNTSGLDTCCFYFTIWLSGWRGCLTTRKQNVQTALNAISDEWAIALATLDPSWKEDCIELLSGVVKEIQRCYPAKKAKRRLGQPASTALPSPLLAGLERILELETRFVEGYGGKLEPRGSGSCELRWRNTFLSGVNHVTKEPKIR